MLILLCESRPQRADSSPARHLSNRLAPLVEPRSGVLIPPVRENIKEKSLYFRTDSYLK